MYPTLLWTAGILLALYLYFRQVYTKFSRYGIKHSTPIPPFGNMTRMLLMKEHLAYAIERVYRSFSEERFVGLYEFTKTQLVIRDLELIKKITVKDFEYFHDHRHFVDTGSDPLLGRMLIFLKGQEWKKMRSVLTPAFTGSKIRLMVPLMVEVGEQMMKVLREKSQGRKLRYIDVDVKEMTLRFAIDAIASCGFGLKVDSHLEKGEKFFADVKDATTIEFLQLLKIFGFILVPKLMKVLKRTLFSDSTNHFYRHMVMSTMQDRKERNIIKPDVIQLLMNVEKEWSDNDLVAQTIPLVFGGFETVSSAMSSLLYELALNPEVQEKLYQEIMENETKNGGKLDYNSIQQMTYMDMVVSESLRLWPPVTSLDRVCIKDYNCGKPNDKAKEDFIVRKGDNLNIPVWAIHRDPQYFPDPLKFDPERFFDENKHKIHPFTYMPFGLGPRNCIASRFALCDVKVMAYQLLKEMELSPSAKTCIPAKLSTAAIFIKFKENHWVRMTPRN